MIQSAITMLAYGDRIRRKTIDLAELASYWIERDRAPAPRLRPRPRRRAGRALDRRALPRVHGRPEGGHPARVRDVGSAAHRAMSSRGSTATSRPIRAASTGRWSTTSRAISASTWPRCASGSRFYYERFGVRREPTAGEAGMSDAAGEAARVRPRLGRFLRIRAPRRSPDRALRRRGRRRSTAPSGTGS